MPQRLVEMMENCLFNAFCANLKKNNKVNKKNNYANLLENFQIEYLLFVS